MKTAYFAFLLLILPFYLCANLVYNQPLEHTQPDGTKLNLFVSGDEYNHRVHDEKGFTVLLHPDTGFAVYAIADGNSIKASDYVVGKVNPAAMGIQPKLMKHVEITEPTTQPQYKYGPIENQRFTTGLINNIVCFVRFQDQTEFPTTRDYLWYNKLFNNTNQQSLKDYYKEVSDDQLAIQSYLFPPEDINGYVFSYTIPFDRGTFSPYNAVTNPIGYTTEAERTARHMYLSNTLCGYLDNAIPDQLDVDLDNDGSIDGLTFLFRGPTDGWSDLLWPAHVTWTEPIGVINYTPVNHYVKLFDDPLGTAVMCHETGHMIGFPDLYHYVSNGINPVGVWDLMASGPTVHELTYMKWRYGAWFTSIPEIIPTANPTEYSLTAIDQNPYSCYKIQSNNPDQFYVLEYRRQSGRYEVGLPSSGLVVSRIIDNYAGSDVIGNSAGPPDEVYVYRHGGTIDYDGFIDDANFCANAGRVEFHNETTTKPWIYINPTTYALGNLVLTDIGLSGGDTITFKVSNSIPAVWVWDGSFNSNWNDPFNWNKNSVPAYYDDVEIAGGVPNFPVLDEPVQVNSLTIKEGATLTINNSTLNISYQCQNFGTLVMNHANSTLNAESLTFRSGSVADISDSGAEITVRTNLDFNFGSDIQINQGIIIFWGTEDSELEVNAPATINNLRIAKTSPYNVTLVSDFSSNLTINGNLDVYPGNHLINSLSNILIIKGNLNNSSGYFTNTTGTVRFEGTAASSVNNNVMGSSYFNTLSIAKTGNATVTLSTPVEVMGSLSISNGASLVVIDNALLVHGDLISYGDMQQTGTGDVTVNGLVRWGNGSTADMTNAVSEMYVRGHMYFDAGSDINMTNGTIEFLGPNSSGIYVNAIAHIYNLRNNKEVGAFLGTSPTSDHDLYIDGNFTNLIDRLFKHQYSGAIHLKGSFINNILGVFWFNDGSISFDGNTNQSFDNYSSLICYFNHVTIAKTDGAVLNLNTHITLRGGVYINSGVLQSNNHNIYLEGSWTNMVGEAAFIEGDGGVIFNGTGNQYCGSEHFGTLDLNKSSGELIIPAGAVVTCDKYNWTAGVYRMTGGTFNVLNRLVQPGIYGTIYLDSGTINYHQDAETRNDFNGTLYISGGAFNMYGGSDDCFWAYAAPASLNMTGGILDFREKSIIISDTAYSFSFSLTGGTVRTIGDYKCIKNNVHLNGGTLELFGHTDNVVFLAPASSVFNLNINKSPSRNERDNTTAADSDLLITGDLTISQGTFAVRIWNLQVNGNISVNGILSKTSPGSIITYGDFIWQSGSASNITAGTIQCSRNWRFYSGCTVDLSLVTTTLNSGQPAEITASSPNAWFGPLNITGVGMVTVSSFTIVPESTDALIVKGALTISGSNTVRSEGRLIKTENSVTVNANCVLSLGPDAMLRLKIGTSLAINNGGTLEVQGSAGHPATITHLTTGYYYFNVESGATISADYGIFEYMQPQGVNVKIGALVNSTHAFNYCTFRNGYLNGVLLTVDNNQAFTVYSANFPTSAIASSYNVKKIVNLGTVTFINATGAFAGESYDNDTYNRINWVNNYCNLIINDASPDIAELYVGEGLTYGITIYNNSAYSTIVPIRVDVYFNPGAIPPAGETGDLSFYMNPLDAYGADVYYFPEISSEEAGVWFSRFRVDALNEITETNETDNDFADNIIEWLALPSVQNLTIVYNQDTERMVLNWTYPDPAPYDNFRIYRSSNPYGPFDTLISTTTNTTFSPLTTGAKYFYQIRAEKTWP